VETTFFIEFGVSNSPLPQLLSSLEMSKKLPAFACLLTAFLTSCDRVSLSSFYYTPRSLPVAALRSPLDKTAKQFSLEPLIDQSRPDRLVYFDEPRAAGPHLGVTAELPEGRIVIMEMFTFSPSPRMLAYEQAMISYLAAAGISVSRNAPQGTRGKYKKQVVPGSPLISHQRLALPSPLLKQLRFPVASGFGE